MDKQISSLCAFLDASHSQFHAVEQVCNWLSQEGYVRLAANEAWKLTPGTGYYTVSDQSALVAFRVPKEAPVGYLISASHSDRPTFALREEGELKGQYTRLSTERYGGMLMYTWMDRPLSVAGRVTVETKNGIESRLVDLDRDLTMMPSVAIHMDRNLNENHRWDPTVDTVPLLGGEEAAGKLSKLLEEAAGGKILSHDLYLYVRQKACVWGVEEEYLSAPALDDLECVWGCAQGFLQAKESRSIPVLSVFDSEEVGSNSPQGAASTLLGGVLERISTALKLEHPRMLANSFMVSADNAHALHPNRPELSDRVHAPKPNGGIVIKTSASLSYTSSALSSGVFRKLCQRANVPTQRFHNRADMRGGSTLGHISLGQVSVPSVDIGLAQLAMHSCYETGGTKDSIYLKDAMTAYYSATLTATENGFIIE